MHPTDQIKSQPWNDGIRVAHCGISVRSKYGGEQCIRRQIECLYSVCSIRRGLPTYCKLQRQDPVPASKQVVQWFLGVWPPARSFVALWLWSISAFRATRELSLVCWMNSFSPLFSLNCGCILIVKHVWWRTSCVTWDLPMRSSTSETGITVEFKVRCSLSRNFWGLVVKYHTKDWRWTIPVRWNAEKSDRQRWRTNWNDYSLEAPFVEKVIFWNARSAQICNLQIQTLAFYMPCACNARAEL